MVESAEYYRSIDAERQLLGQIRHSLISELDISERSDSGFSFSFNPTISQVYITLFQEGVASLRWGAKKATLKQSVSAALLGLKKHGRFFQFNVADSSVCRIMMEVVTESYPCNIRNMTLLKFGKDRFEPGVTGLYCKYNDMTRFFMPTDAVTHSVMSVNQVLNFISKRFGIAKQTSRISERVHLMRRLPIKYAFIKSRAFITYKDEVLPLHRGYPVPVALSKGRIEATMLNSMRWLVENMKEDGKFLYFYDPVKDTEIDFQHPAMIDPPYYNILRHSGGTIALLLGYDYNSDRSFLKAARKSIDFFISTLHEHTVDGAYACYPFFNKKAKLGGSGIGLVALMHYYRLTGDGCYNRYAEGLVRHILSRIEPDGEMIGYYIHPKFHDGEPLVGLDTKEKKALFSFYYPGEALLGLAMYVKWSKETSESFLSTIRTQSKKALDFLVKERPSIYAELFEPLPSDGWLMQAIETWDELGNVEDEHREFVYSDAKKMMAHMYGPQNVPGFDFDYAGGFYYEYGDHVYHDASRCEGLIAAYRLAKQNDLTQLSSKIFNSMLLSAKGLLYTYNTAESTYAHKYPKRSIGAFRFKLTRQWVRVDSVQHTACFYAGLSRLL